MPIAWSESATKLIAAHFHCKGAAMEKTGTNAKGTRWYIERAKDFDDSGRMVDGRGYFAGIIRGQCYESGVWFPTYAAAINAVTVA